MFARCQSGLPFTPLVAALQHADSIIRPAERELVPFLKRMLTLTAKQREGSRFSVGFR